MGIFIRTNENILSKFHSIFPLRLNDQFYESLESFYHVNRYRALMSLFDLVAENLIDKEILFNNELTEHLNWVIRQEWLDNKGGIEADYRFFLKLDIIERCRVLVERYLDDGRYDLMIEYLKIAKEYTIVDNLEFATWYNYHMGVVFLFMDLKEQAQKAFNHIVRTQELQNYGARILPLVIEFGLELTDFNVDHWIDRLYMSKSDEGYDFFVWYHLRSGDEVLAMTAFLQINSSFLRLRWLKDYAIFMLSQQQETALLSVLGDLALVDKQSVEIALLDAYVRCGMYDDCASRIHSNLDVYDDYVRAYALLHLSECYLANGNIIRGLETINLVEAHCLKTKDLIKYHYQMAALAQAGHKPSQEEAVMTMVIDCKKIMLRKSFNKILNMEGNIYVATV